MKTEMKQKQIRANYDKVFYLTECSTLSNLIDAILSPCGFNAGVYGWNFNVYEFGGNAVTIGYRPIGKPLQDEKELVKLIHKKCRKNKYGYYNPEKLTSVITGYLNGI